MRNFILFAIVVAGGWWMVSQWTGNDPVPGTEGVQTGESNANANAEDGSTGASNQDVDASMPPTPFPFAIFLRKKNPL